MGLTDVPSTLSIQVSEIILNISSRAGFSLLIYLQKSGFELGEQTIREDPEQPNLLILKPSVCSALYSLLMLAYLSS